MIERLVNLIFEALFLKDKKHEGLRRIGVQFPPSVAEHSLIAAQIGYILAKMEGADVAKVVSILIWHDLPEARIGDLDKVAIRYIPNKQEAEQNALRAQMEGVDFGEEILSLIQEMDEKVTLEGKIAKDADYLEAAFQAKKYLELGHTMAQNHMDNVWNALRTESGKLLFAEMKNTHSTDRRHKASLQDLSKV